MSFGDNVRMARQAARMTQLELGRLSGFGRTSITAIEGDTQDVTLAGLHAIADALAVSPVSLLSGFTDDTVQVRAMLKKTLMVLDWEAMRLRSTADAVDELIVDIRQALAVVSEP